MDLLTVVKRNPLVFPLACVAAAAMVFISEGSYWQSVGTLSEMREMANARTSILGLKRSIVAVETGQRGYLLTGRIEYLKPYGQALKSIDESFAALERHYDKDEQPKQVLQKLRGLTDTRLSVVAETIRLHAEGQAATAMELELSGVLRKDMDAVLALGDQLLDQETRNVASGQVDVDRTLLLSRIGVAALSVVILLALYLYLRQNIALLQQQLDAQRLVQAERDRLEVEVTNRTAQLTELAHHLQTAREDERSRLARDLHDELGALLTSAKLDAARIKSRLAGIAPEAQERLAHLVSTLNSVIELKRSITEDLRPSALSHLGLAPTLQILAREFSERSGIQVQCALEPVNLSSNAELMVYRVVQEAITNISKYAHARHVWLDLGSQNGEVQLSVRDDGIGFDSRAQRAAAHGLLGMRFRVEAEQGKLTVVSTPGQGTVIRASLREAALG